MALTEWLALFGVKIVTLVAGFFGATTALVGTPKLTLWQLVLSIFAGMAFAVYVEPVVTHYFGLPPQVQGGVAFVLGLGGLVACAGMLEVYRAAPSIALAWLRRKFGGAE
jgi:tellurite resistance protein TehA-like permease